MIIPRLFSSNRSLLHLGLAIGFFVWLAAQIPLSFALNRYFARLEHANELARQASVQKLLVELFDQSARFGDLVYARGVILRLGSGLGLKDIGICKGQQEVLPRPLETRCKSGRGDRVIINTPIDEYELEFNWQPPSISGQEFGLRSFAAGALLSLMLISSLAFILSRSLSRRVKGLSQQIADANSLETLTKLSFEIAELVPIREALQTSIAQLSASQEENVRLKAESTIGSIARQVSHDIRSPLATLQAVIHNSANIDEQTRIQVRTAVGRIGDIANGLLVRSREQTEISTELQASQGSASSLASMASKSVEYLYSLLETAASQKTIQFSSRSDIKISTTLSTEAAGIFVEINPTELDRIISNTVNNSIEAFDKGSGRVDIFLHRLGGRACIQIRDNGRGIPPELLPKVVERGGTFGKSAGNGLGLSHAKATVEAWGGNFRIESTLGEGTTVTLELPIAEMPSWFASELSIRPGTTVVIADDDASFHQLWESRLAEITPPERRIHLYSPEEFLDCYRKTLPLLGSIIYLCDHEFLGHAITGLDLIEMTGTASQAILVTNRWDDHHIRCRCEKLGLKILPKALAAIITISG